MRKKNNKKKPKSLNVLGFGLSDPMYRKQTKNKKKVVRLNKFNKKIVSLNRLNKSTRTRMKKV